MRLIGSCGFIVLCSKAWDSMAGEEQEPRRFTLSAAERARRELEPTLAEAVELMGKLGELDDTLGQVAQRILLMGGITIPHESLARVRAEHDRVAGNIHEAIEKIQSTGCIVKDLEKGLVDFPARMNNEDVYLCWRLGEKRIRFWHRQDEGFAGRKPIDPNDTGPNDPIQ
ncbi:MAG: DUF2203 domain-containing protein [Candidatus Acidiferrales bacterium]